MISVEAKQIGKLFSFLKKRNVIITNFNTNRRMGRGQAFLCDHLIITPVAVHFIEVKLIGTKDKPSDGQKKLASLIKNIQQKHIQSGVFYWEVKSLDDAETVFKYLIEETNGTENI